MSLNRRDFVERALHAAAAALAVGSGLKVSAAEESAPSRTPGPNDKLRVAVIGVNGQGGSHLGEWLKNPDVDLVAVCDCDPNAYQKHVGKFKDLAHPPEYVQDVRKLLEKKDIDAVSIATPNHWHALMAVWAMQSGKDVYVEKPCSHNVREGRVMTQWARKLGRMCQMGVQSRSMTGMRETLDFVHSGKIGKVTAARAVCYRNRASIGLVDTPAPIPEGLDFDLWCGPAPKVVPTRKRLHYDWHWMWEYGNGDLGNQGIHQMDLARWGLGVNELSKGIISYGGRFSYVDAGETANTQVAVHDYGNKSLVFEVRGLKTDDHKGAKVGVIFEGTDGYVVMTTYANGIAFDKDGNKIREFKGDGNHFANFISAVRSRKSTDLHADILEGHLSSALCHTANISYRLGTKISWADAEKQLDSIKTTDNAKATFERTVAHLKANNVDLAAEQVQFGPALVCDPKTETFPGNEAANKMLTREYRAPYVVPNADNV